MFKKTICPECGAMWNEGVYDACPNCGWVVGADTPLKRAREEAERIEQDENAKREKEMQKLETKRLELERVRAEMNKAKQLEEAERAVAECLRKIGSQKLNATISKTCSTIAVVTSILSIVFSVVCFCFGITFLIEDSGIYVFGAFTLLVGGGLFLIIGILCGVIPKVLGNIFSCLFNINEFLRNK